MQAFLIQHSLEPVSGLNLQVKSFGTSFWADWILVTLTSFSRPEDDLNIFKFFFRSISLEPVGEFVLDLY